MLCTSLIDTQTLRQEVSACHHTQKNQTTKADSKKGAKEL
jgi:hypothetical protein